MKKITLEKVLWFVGRLIRAVFLIAWNLTRVSVVLFLALFFGGEGRRRGSNDDVGMGIRDMSDWIWDD